MAATVPGVSGSPGSRAGNRAYEARTRSAIGPSSSSPASTSPTGIPSGSSEGLKQRQAAPRAHSLCAFVQRALGLSAPAQPESCELRANLAGATVPSPAALLLLCLAGFEESGSRLADSFRGRTSPAAGTLQLYLRALFQALWTHHLPRMDWQPPIDQCLVRDAKEGVLGSQMAITLFRILGASNQRTSL